MVVFNCNLSALTILQNDIVSHGVEKDSIVSIQNYQIHITLPPAYVYGFYKFKNNKERARYNKLVRDVCKTYPYAKMITLAIIETYEYMETLPDDKAKQKHLEKVKKYMMDTYKPQMKKMTKTQGKILIKLINRECGSSSYDVVKAIIGSFQAGVYNVFAGLFGNSLKATYDPEGDDKEIEEIVLLIQQGVYDWIPQNKLGSS